jgi:hypothetical protein
MHKDIVHQFAQELVQKAANQPMIVDLSSVSSEADFPERVKEALEGMGCLVVCDATKAGRFEIHVKRIPN